MAVVRRSVLRQMQLELLIERQRDKSKTLSKVKVKEQAMVRQSAKSIHEI